MKNIKIILGSNIKYLRKKNQLSQEKLAEKALLHRTYIGAIERGERNVSLENIDLIAKVFNVNAYELLKDRDDFTL